MEESLDTYYDQAINTSVLHLPFNSSYSMLLLLPDDMATLENTICPGHVTKWLKWMKSRYGESKIILSLFLLWKVDTVLMTVLRKLFLSDQLFCQINHFVYFPLFFKGHIIYIFQSSPSSLPTT